MLNFALMKHPINWVIVFLMTFIAGIAINEVTKYHILPTVKTSS